jgi:hypothetical protein
MNLKVIVVVLALAGIVLGETRLVNTLYAGLALATGEGSSDMNPGITACLEPVVVVNKYFACGGHLDYAWLTATKPSDAPSDFRAGTHLWDIAFVPKALVPIAADMNLAFEIDPGFNMTLAYVHGGSFDDSEFKPHFGLTSGISYTVKVFSFAFKFKNVFLENDSVNWVTFTVGYQVN